MNMKKIYIGTFAILSAIAGCAQERPLDMKMDFEDYDPPSTLVVPEHVLTRAKYPFVDVHNECGAIFGPLPMEPQVAVVNNHLHGEVHGVRHGRYRDFQLAK